MKTVPLAALALALLSGCTEPCDAAVLAQETTWGAFASFWEFEATAPAAYPTATSPANGPVELGFVFEAPNVPDAEVTVLLDGQAFPGGSARFDARQCGWFEARWSGMVQAEGAVHDFTADGFFTVVEDRIEGVVDWLEEYSSPRGSGAVDGTVLLRGEPR